MNTLIIVGGVVVLFIAVFGISLWVSNAKTKRAATATEQKKQLEEAAEAGERQDAQQRKSRGKLLDRLYRIATRMPHNTEGSS